MIGIEHIIYTRRKECVRCKSEKDLNLDNFPRSGNHYSSICMICYIEEKEKRKGTIYKSINIEDKGKLKTCPKCKIEKEVTENFYLRKKMGKNGNRYYHTYCKECSSILKEERKEDIKKYNRESYIKYKAHKIYSAYKQGDMKNGRENNLTKDFIIQILKEVCSYCSFPSVGLDRIDNYKGRTKDNCIPCCKECNIARMDSFSIEEMKIIGKAIRRVKLMRIEKQ